MNNDRQEHHQFQFRGIHLPALVVTMLADRQINRTELSLLIMVESLVQAGGDGCYATNPYFGKRLELHRFNVAKLISRLKSRGLLIVTNAGGRRFLETCWSRTTAERETIAQTTMPPVAQSAIQNKYKKNKVSPLTRSARPQADTALTDQHFKWADRLKSTIVNGLRHRAGWSRRAWATQMRLAADNTSPDRVERCLAWFEKNYLKFTLQSASRFRSSITDMEKFIRNDPATVSGPPHPQTEAAVAKLTGDLRWPRHLKDQLPRAVSAALQQIDHLYARRKATQLPPGLASLFDAITTAIRDKRHFVRQHYESFHAWMERKGAKPEKLPALNFGEKGGLTKLCRAVALEHSGTDTRWDDLKEAIDL